MVSQLPSLAILLLLGFTLAASADPNFDQSAMLRAFTISCKDCNTLQYGDGTFVEYPCPAGTLCGPVGTAFNCIPEDSADAASCSCGDKENTYIPEPYASNKYIACLPGGDQSVLECEAGQIFTGDTDVPCAKGPECTTAAGAEKGFNALLPDCTKYYFCDDVGAAAPAPSERADALPVPTYECPEGQVYDVTKLNCVDPCTLAPEPFVCEPAASGSFADLDDCQIFHLCFGGTKIGDPIPCPEDKYFNADTGACDGTDDIVCKQVLNVCYTAEVQATCA